MAKEIKPEEEQQLLDDIKNSYETQTSPYYAAARLWVDDIIDPIQTREIIAGAICAANNNPDFPDLKLGVFQV